jgi:hypothetical protein
MTDIVERFAMLYDEVVAVVEQLQAEVERLQVAERERCAAQAKRLLSGLGIDHIAAEVSDLINKGELMVDERRPNPSNVAPDVAPEDCPKDKI